MIWRWVGLPVAFLGGLWLAYLYGYTKGYAACKIAVAESIAISAVETVTESQKNEDAIRQRPPQDDAPMAPVLADTLERLRAEQ